MSNDLTNFSKHYFLCMIMPAKNVEKYIYEAIMSYISHDRDDILLIIIDDHSTDKTYEICNEIKTKNKTKILLKKNILAGKVNAINYGFSLASASYYKFVDSDDVLEKNFWDMLDRNSKNFSSFIHPFKTVDESLKNIGLLPMPKLSLSRNKKYIQNLILLPKAAWTLKNEDIDGMFPIPDDMPFEDIWFSIYIYAKNIKIINESASAYLYRQHGSQTYGNIGNINEERTIFRYRRIYLALKIIEKLSIFKRFEKELSSAKVIALYMLRKVSIKTLFEKSGFLIGIKHIILRDFKLLYELVRSLTWLIRRMNYFIKK